MASLLLSLILSGLTSLVNPFVGTDTHGHTFPAGATPTVTLDLDAHLRGILRIWDCEVPVDVSARFVKVFARNIGTIPDWHPGAGSPGFIFIDEIWVK